MLMSGCIIIRALMEIVPCTVKMGRDGMSTVEGDDEEGSRKAQVRLRSYRFSCRLPLQRIKDEENAGSFLPAQNLNPVSMEKQR